MDFAGENIERAKRIEWNGIEWYSRGIEENEMQGAKKAKKYQLTKSTQRKLLKKGKIEREREKKKKLPRIQMYYGLLSTPFTEHRVPTNMARFVCIISRFRVSVRACISFQAYLRPIPHITHR